MIPALVLALSVGNSSPRAFVDVRLSSGGEYDTNALRAISQRSENAVLPNQNLTVVSDGLVRTALTGAGTLLIDRRGQHVVSGQLIIGSKQFLNRSSEDLLVQNLGLTFTSHLPGPFQLLIDAKGRLSRIRNNLRDYNQGSLRAELTWQIFRLSLGLSGGFQTFRFLPEKNFSYHGPRVGLRLRWPFSPSLRFEFQTRVSRRVYPRALVLTTVSNSPDPVPILSFCEDMDELEGVGLECQPVSPRRDTEYTSRLSIRYVGDVRLTASYQLGLQRSNSTLENLNRHRFTVSTSIALPWELNLSVRGALQINDGTSQTERQLLAEDDENQNSLQAQLQRKMTRIISAELRYALFVNQFGSSNVVFERHAIYFGLALHAQTPR